MPRLGFYLDDWFSILSQKTLGMPSIQDLFRIDDPSIGWVYQLAAPIFQESRFAWQLFALLSYSLAACLFWWLLKMILPSRMKIVNAAALFFAVFPAFEYHWISIQYGHFFFLLAVYFASFILMIRAVKSARAKWLFIFAALVCMALSLFPQGYFIGFEVIRPILLGIVISQNVSDQKRSRTWFIQWLPYLILTLCLIIFRLIVSSSQDGQPLLRDQFAIAPLETLAILLGRLFNGLQQTVLDAWVYSSRVFTQFRFGPSYILMLGIIFAGGLLAFLRIRSDFQDNTKHANKRLIWLAILASFAAILPFLSGFTFFSSGLPDDHYYLVLAPGASILLAVLIDSLLDVEWHKLALCISLIALSLGFHYNTARVLTTNWKLQQDFFTQLAWRAPDLKPGTTIVTGNLPFEKLTTSTSLTAPLNLLYSSISDATQLPYLLVTGAEDGQTISSYSPDQPILWRDHSFEFTGNTSQILAVNKLGSNCVQVLDSNDFPAEVLRSGSLDFWKAVIPISKPESLILSGQAVTLPASPYFGVEDQNQWCYYFEKADLARQEQQWDQTIAWYQKAQAAGYGPGIESEWMPLLEAYLNTGQIDLAVNLTRDYARQDPIFLASYCALWQANKDNPEYSDETKSILIWLECNKINTQQ